MHALFLLGNQVLHFYNLHHIYNQSYNVLRTNNIKLLVIQIVSGNGLHAERWLNHMICSNSKMFFTALAFSFGRIGNVLETLIAVLLYLDFTLLSVNLDKLL